MVKILTIGTLGLLLAGCVGNASGRGAGEPLLTTLQARTSGDHARFVLRVTNTTDVPLTLEYRTGQSFDFVVLEGDREVWRWSADQMFTQALRRETLAPGETLAFEADWHPEPDAAGAYVVVGRLTAHSHPAEQRAAFRLP